MKKTIEGYVQKKLIPRAMVEGIVREIEDWVFKTEDEEYTVTIPAAIDQILDVDSQAGEKYRITIEKLED